MERMNYLIEILNKASKAYYQPKSDDTNVETMTDIEYDALYDELLILEGETGIVLENSPTQTVGYEVLSNLQKITHEKRMLSLDKTKEIGAIVSFLGEQIGVLSWKLDGLTIVLTYENGKLAQAVTRGNGEIGEDITHNANVFKNTPKTIEFQGKLVIRGEAVISYSDFEKLNETMETGEKYKNPRNLTAGAVRQLNSEISAKRNVQFKAFTLVVAENVEFENSKIKQLEFLKGLGFSVVEFEKVGKHNIEKVMLQFKDNVASNDFATDGLVLTFDSISYSQSLGETSKFPKDSIAFKWADETAQTTLLKVLWNVSRTGHINPIAIFEPVELEGTTVSRASVHNLSIVESLELGCGDEISVYKANMIIPQILANVTKSGTIEPPTTCPVCGNKTEIVMANDAKFLYCKNISCKAQIVRALSHFVGRNQMNIDGLSEATIEKFVTVNIISNYTDLFSLGEHEETIKQMEGFGEKSFDNLIKSIEKAKKVALPNFIHALGIEQVGLQNAKLLCKHFDYDVAKIISADVEQLLEVDGFGEVIAEKVTSYFRDESNLRLFNKVLEMLEIQKPKELDLPKTLNAMVFVITGNLEKFENRQALQLYIEQLGAKATNSVTSKTTYLINNDLTSGSSKNVKAKSLNVPIINEEQFLEIAQRSGETL